MPLFCVRETMYDTDDSCEVHELKIVTEKKDTEHGNMRFVSQNATK